MAQPIWARIDTVKERRAVAADLAIAAVASEIVTLHPTSFKRYARNVTILVELIDAHADLSEAPELTATLRRLITEVVITAAPARTDYVIEVEESLTQLIGSAVFPPVFRGETLVAREGLEPPTPGL